MKKFSHFNVRSNTETTGVSYQVYAIYTQKLIFEGNKVVIKTLTIKTFDDVKQAMDCAGTLNLTIGFTAKDVEDLNDVADWGWESELR